MQQGVFKYHDFQNLTCFLSVHIFTPTSNITWKRKELVYTHNSKNSIIYEELIKMSRFDVSDYNATELNEAVDATNFPRSNSLVSNGSGRENGTFRFANGSRKSSMNGDEQNGEMEHEEEEQNNSVGDLVPRSAAVPISGASTVSGFIRRPHPSPLKVRGFSEDKFDIPGTPITPRTATTPGKLLSVPLSFFLERC